MRFPAAKTLKMQAGDLSPCTLSQYKQVAKWLKQHMTAHRIVEDVGPADFLLLRSKFDPKWSATTIKNQVTLIRMILKWAFVRYWILLGLNCAYGNSDLSRLIKSRRQDIGYVPQLAKKHDTIAGFIDEYLLNPVYESELSRSIDDDCVTIITIHSAKGLEASRCFVVDVQPGTERTNLIAQSASAGPASAPNQHSNLKEVSATSQRLTRPSQIA